MWIISLKVILTKRGKQQHRQIKKLKKHKKFRFLKNPVLPFRAIISRSITKTTYQTGRPESSVLIFGILYFQLKQGGLKNIIQINSCSHLLFRYPDNTILILYLKNVFLSYYETSIKLIPNVEMDIKEKLYTDIPHGHNNKNP